VKERAYPALQALGSFEPGPRAEPAGDDSDVKQWLARELHDSVVQALSTMVIEMEQFKLAGRARNRETDHLEHLQAEARQTLAELRATIGELRGQYQADFQLLSAVSAAAERLHQATGIGTALSIAPSWPRRLPRALARNLYRIIEEALNNVRAHSRATQVTITMWTAGETGMISVSDDGMGFVDAGPALRPLDGLGLVGMRERAALVGGSMRIESEPGQGTKVALTFPLALER